MGCSLLMPADDISYFIGAPVHRVKYRDDDAAGDAEYLLYPIPDEAFHYDLAAFHRCLPFLVFFAIVWKPNCTLLTNAGALVDLEEGPLTIERPLPTEKG